MKQLIAGITTILLVQLAMAQDQLVLHSGNTIRCTVAKISEDYITYAADNDHFLRNIQSKKVKEILFGSGLYKAVSQALASDKQLGWEAVQIISKESDVRGLTPGETLEVTVTRTIRVSKNQDVDLEKAYKEIKMLAASKGYGWVKIDTIDKSIKGVPKHRKSIVKIVAQGYSDIKTIQEVAG